MRPALLTVVGLLVVMATASCSRHQLTGSLEGFGGVVAQSAEWDRRLEQETHGIGTPAPDLGPVITPTGEAVNSPLFDDSGRYLGAEQAAP